MWLELRGKGIDVARCTVERLMKTLGLQGADQPGNIHTPP
jgi:hypothetical protein